MSPDRRAAAAATLVATLMLAGCGVRLETPERAAASADAVEQLRQRAAVAADALAQTAQLSAAAGEGEWAGHAQDLADDAAAQAALLGGVLRPSGRTLTPIRVARGEVAFGSYLADATAALRAEAADADGDLALVLSSVAVSWSWWREQLAPDLAPEPAGLPQTLPADTAGDLVRTYDALGYAWEVVAARAADGERDDALAQARRDRERAQQLAESAGVADTPEDPREVSYGVGDDVRGAIDAWERSLLPAWLAQVPGTEGEDRDRVIGQAVLALDGVSDEPGDLVTPGLAG